MCMGGMTSCTCDIKLLVNDNKITFSAIFSKPFLRYFEKHLVILNF